MYLLKRSPSYILMVLQLFQLGLVGIFIIKTLLPVELKESTGKLPSQQAPGSANLTSSGSVQSPEIDDGRKYIVFHMNKQPYVPPPQYPNVRGVLNSHGWREITDPHDNFSLIWPWEIPEEKWWWKIIKNMQSHQHINYVPGLTASYKDKLSTFGFSFVPKSFNLESEIDKLEEYVLQNPNATFMFKGKTHRGYRYYPFDPANTLKFTMKPKSKFPENVPGIATMYPTQIHKDIITAHLTVLGHDPRLVWQRIDNIVAEVLLNDQMSVIQALEGYSYIENFFQLLRFDFMLDDKVYLLEVNHGPDIEVPSGEAQKRCRRRISGILRLKGLIDVSNPTDEIKFLTSSYHEHLRSLDQMHRIYPPPIGRCGEEAEKLSNIATLPKEDQLLQDWFRAKCLENAFWCQ